jgi:hypothetical protein
LHPVMVLPALSSLCCCGYTTRHKFSCSAPSSPKFTQPTMEAIGVAGVIFFRTRYWRAAQPRPALWMYVGAPNLQLQSRPRPRKLSNGRAEAAGARLLQIPRSRTASAHLLSAAVELRPVTRIFSAAIPGIPDFGTSPKVPTATHTVLDLW